VAALNVSKLPYADRLTAACLEGLANREAPRLFLDFGIYDDPSARRTNEDFLPDAIWQAKFRAAVGDQDAHNLAYYRKRFGLTVSRLRDLRAAVRASRDRVRGLVVWDPQLPDTANVAIMLAGLEDLLVVAPDRIAWAEREFGLEVRQDLRGRWRDRLELYTWALENLQPRCEKGTLACVEPAWQRPEFADYLVAHRVFTYSLSSAAKTPLFRAGQTLLLLLIGGPFALRNLLFDLHLEGVVKSLGLWLMGLGSPETRLALRIQRSLAPVPTPTIFGWHTTRDDELAFMLLLSASNLRLVPAHLAGNFSFHSRLPAPKRFAQAHIDPASVTLEDTTYLTFTLSDGDQLVLMGTGELGNWRRKERGRVPFNWEVQPLLVDLAPALLAHYYETRSAADYLIGGPSGAGYIIPPLNTRREAYLAETARACRAADLRTFTPYIGDPPRRLIREYGAMPGDFTGFIGGYAHFGRTPAYLDHARPFLSYTWPYFQNVWDSSEQVLAAVRHAVEAPGPRPRFIAVHLFAYRTTLPDVHAFVQTLDPQAVKVVRADEFLIAAQKTLTHQGDPT
jgi:GxGYxYP putative glycoside hydrolase C-terminal domain/GxGYxYP_N second domain